MARDFTPFSFPLMMKGSPSLSPSGKDSDVMDPASQSPGDFLPPSFPFQKNKEHPPFSFSLSFPFFVRSSKEGMLGFGSGFFLPSFRLEVIEKWFSPRPPAQKMSVFSHGCYCEASQRWNYVFPFPPPLMGAFLGRRGGPFLFVMAQVWRSVFF